MKNIYLIKAFSGYIKNYRDHLRSITCTEQGVGSCCLIKIKPSQAPFIQFECQSGAGPSLHKLKMKGD